MSSTSSVSNFPIPASLSDLEREPHNLQPYPLDFDDEDETARAKSFNKLVRYIETGNRTLIDGGSEIFENVGIKNDDGYCQEEWMNGERIQALYTLVRKQASLASNTRSRFLTALCQALNGLCIVLSDSNEQIQPSSPVSVTRNDNPIAPSLFQKGRVVSQSFRDSLACHIYMLFSVMSMVESEAKAGKKFIAPPTATKKKRSTKDKDIRADYESSLLLRQDCASTMLLVSQIMGKHKFRLWKVGVPDEDVINIPPRIAHQMLEGATGVIMRKAFCADEALGILAAILDSYSSCCISTIVAALMDFLHSYEHAAPLVADLCCLVSETPKNKLAVEILREMGRIECHSVGFDTGNKASGIKNVAPFIEELAIRRPKIVMDNISLVLPHLDSEPYVIRSAVVNAIAHVVSRANESDVKKKISRYSACSPQRGSNFLMNEENSSNNEGHSKNNNSAFILQEESYDTGIQSKQKNRDALLDILIERAHDVSSFTRAAVLKSFAQLTESDSLPLDRVIPVTALAIDRLQDKTVMVRRSSLQLLTLLLENNPFMDSLDPIPYRQKIVELEKMLEENAPERIKLAQKAAKLVQLQKEQQSYEKDNMKADGEVKEQEGTRQIDDKEIEAAALDAAIKDAEYECSDNHDDSKEEVEYKKALRGLQFATSALAFICMFENAHSAFEGMLLSANSSDVTEALRFFVRARHFQLPCAVTGMKRALALMWSSEKSIKDEVLKGFVDVFIAVPGTSGAEYLADDKIAQNLFSLVGNANISEIASIEEAVALLVKQDRLPAEVFMELWSIVSKPCGQGRSVALQVLSMGATTDSNIVNSLSRLRLLLECGLGENAEDNRDWATLRSAASALKKIGRAQASSSPTSAKYILLEQIIDRLCRIAMGEWCLDKNITDTQCWFAAAEQAIDAIFEISAEPEKESAKIIKGMEAMAFGMSGRGVEVSKKTCCSLRLARFFFVVGHIAVKLLVYTEALSISLRRANAAKSLSKQESADKAKSSDNDEAKIKEDSDEDIEAELGLAAQAEAETEKKVADIAENEIVERGLIGLFSPLLVRIVANEGLMHSSSILMQSATLALCKLMCISGVFCEKNLPLLFRALSKAPVKETTLKSNIIIALGDLAFRFPNAVEPYTPMLYACLNDSVTSVRRHTLMVLTHLILNDMIKVKGQVCEIAVCLEDKEPRIRDMSRLLFHELSKRSNNPIYNLLPDIISRMGLMGIEKEKFRNIMSFLFSFVKKDRQNEMLVEKLCQRFPTTESISQKSDFAFCLTQLKLNDKVIKNLNDHFNCYKDSLFDDDVFKSFTSILSKAKKLARSEMKEVIEEWETRLKQENSNGLENMTAEAKSKAAKANAKARKARKGRENSLDDSCERGYERDCKTDCT